MHMKYFAWNALEVSFVTTIVFRVVVGGQDLEIGCYGSNKDWVCRVSDPAKQQSLFNDAYYPPLVLGFVWFRQVSSQ